MMLKITKIQESRRDVLIKLEGKITDQWATLLDGECQSYFRQEKAVHLDCSHVDFIDARGVEVLNNFPQSVVSQRYLNRFNWLVESEDMHAASECRSS
jgi:anti-anti-sigma regulatory factor